MKKDKNHNNQQYIENSGEQHVAPVAPAWPPAWLAAPALQKSSPDEEVDATVFAHQTRGWRLPSGVVLCGVCHSRPEKAVEVVLVEVAGQLQWVEAQNKPTHRDDIDTGDTADQKGPSPAAPASGFNNHLQHDGDSSPETNEPQWL